MARGWHFTKLSLSSDFFYLFLACALCYCSFLFAFLFCFCLVCMVSLELCRCSSDIFLSSRPRTGLATTYITGYYMVEAQSVNVKTTKQQSDKYKCTV